MSPSQRIANGLYAVIALVAALACSSALGESARAIDLAGTWAVRLDPKDVGVGEEWFRQPLTERTSLPGSLAEQGLGEEVTVDTVWTGSIIDRSWFEADKYAKYRRPGNVKVPFWLQPDKHFLGPAWYQRDVTIPDGWRDRRIVLRLERCHWQTTVWVDETLIGSRDSLSTPHTCDLGRHCPPGEHRITVRVDNRLVVDVGANSHSVTDHTQSNWNGIAGRMELRATDRVWIDDVQVYPDLARKSATVKVVLANSTGTSARGVLTVDAVAQNTDAAHDPPPRRRPVELGESTTVEIDYPLGDGFQTWDEFHPALYRFAVELDATAGGSRQRDATTVTCGMRRIGTRGTEFVLNGRPIFLRGTLDCCIFPRTGYPPTDLDSWRRIVRICKAHGLNHVRFHSWCPPEAAFAAADEAGFYFQVECASWANQGATIGDGKPLDRWLYAEADRILQSYGNHPSFLLMTYGNEPAGPERGAKFLRPWVKHYRAKDSRRLYAGAAAWPLIAENQYQNTPQPRIHAWGSGLNCRLNAKPPETVTDYRELVAKYDVPLVSHEIGQWCVYPNFDEIAKYTGPLKAKNFEIFRDFLDANHMGDQARDFLMASGRLQVLCYKEEIESALRTPGFGGFQLLDLHDFPGQGTALVGMLDPFWDSKPYVTPGQISRFCNQTVPLARLPKRTFTNDERLSAEVEVFHFGPADLKETVVAWRLLPPDGRPVASGSFPPMTIATGRLNRIGPIDVALDILHSAHKLRLVVGIEGTEFENDWEVWLYPARLAPPPEGVLITARLDEAAVARLKSGGKVLLLTPPGTVKGEVALGFTPVFWNTAWTRNQPPHTLGILCDPQSPALAGFPTESHTNWQWWELISRSGAMVLDDLPPKLRPIVQVIDTWFEARRLGLLFEARVSGGKLLVSSIDLESDLAHRPVARQLRRSLLKYMAGDEFQPEHEVAVERVRALFGRHIGSKGP